MKEKILIVIIVAGVAYEILMHEQQSIFVGDHLHSEINFNDFNQRNNFSLSLTGSDGTANNSFTSIKINNK